MTAILTLLASFKTVLIGGAAVIAALVATWFGSKKVATVKTQAKADVQTAQEEVKESQAVTQTQAATIKVAKNADSSNASLSDSAARSKLQGSKYNTTD